MSLRTSTIPPPMDTPARVLVVDDDADLRRTLARLLVSRGFEASTVGSGAEALALLASRPVDVVVMDMRLPGATGLEVLPVLRREHPEVEVIMMTAFADVDTAVRAVREGAYDFLTKPFTSNDTVVLAIEKAAERKKLLDRARELEDRLEAQASFGELIGNSPRMRQIYRVATGVAPTSSTVLILGENGTGKELVARAIHQKSLRADRPFCAINCGAIPENLVETELFGSSRGAFTGALDRPGLFEMADAGTLFLDEVGDLPSVAQVKLLRALAEGEVRRVGAPDAKHVDVRVIAATNVDLRERISAGKFREDLFYRLNVIPIELPPLRERKEDIALLAYHFLKRYARRTGRDVRRIRPDAMEVLQAHDWPGNVRELENAIEHAMVMSRGEALTSNDLPTAFGVRRDSRPSLPMEMPGWGAELGDLPYADAKDRAVAGFEQSYVEKLMQRTHGNVSEAARQAGMDRSNFRRLLKRVRDVVRIPGGDA